jgi:hypothetical protein
MKGLKFNFLPLSIIKRPQSLFLAVWTDETEWVKGVWKEG